MNIEEVLRYNPPTNKLSTINDDDNHNNIDNNEKNDIPSVKRKRLDNNNVVIKDVKDIDKLLSQTNVDNINELDSETLKRLILQLERRQLKNQEMRIKYSDNPTKFMDSEFELFDIIKELHIISTQPKLYDLAIKMNLITKLLGLLSHENTDIACAVVALIQELTDLDDIDEIEQMENLINTLIDGQIIVLLVTNMERLDENIREESEGIYNSLAIIENITDYQPDISKDIKPLILWILRKLKSKTPIYSANKLYSSEILSILLQNSSENRKIIGTLNGIDILLHVISYYKKHDPSTADEEEYLENLFDCLCCSLFMSSKNLELFIQAEGVELMILILKEKRSRQSTTDVRVGALKLLSHCFSHINDDNDDDYELSKQLIIKLSDKFIEILGLRILMPIFLRPTIIIGQQQQQQNDNNKNKRNKKSTTIIIEQIEEYTLIIIVTILKFISKYELRERLLNKFLEQNFFKTERLIELHIKYWERLKKFDELNINNGNDQIDDKLFLKRLNEGGLFILQLIDQIIVMISTNYKWESSSTFESTTTTSLEQSIKQKIYRLLNMHNNNLGKNHINHIELIKSIVNEFIEEKNDSNERNYLSKCTELF